MTNAGKSQRIESSDENEVITGNAPHGLENGRQPVSTLLADVLSAANLQKQAAELLEALETGLPGSQFAPDTRTILHQLLKLAGDLQRDELLNYLRHAERFTAAATIRDRGGFRSSIRLCRELVDQDPNEIAGMAELRVAYLDHQRAELGRLKQALHACDFAVLCKGGHNLKGTGAGYGFSELTDIGRALEVAAKERNAAIAEALLDEIQSYLDIALLLPEER